MPTCEKKSNALPCLYVIGTPGKLGGASTKLAHLLSLLINDYLITLVAPEVWMKKDKGVRQVLDQHGIGCKLLKELPASLEGTALNGG